MAPSYYTILLDANSQAYGVYIYLRIEPYKLERLIDL